MERTKKNSVVINLNDIIINLDDASIWYKLSERCLMIARSLTLGYEVFSNNKKVKNIKKSKKYINKT